MTGGKLAAPLAIGVAVFAVLSLAAVSGVAPTNLLSLVSGLPTPIQHVIVVFLENEPYSAIKSDNGYLWGLCASYACATNVYSPCHPSEPNYLAATSDGTQGRCGTDNPVELGASSLANALDAKSLSWEQYAQAMPKPCDTVDNAPGASYVVHHTPFLMYSYVTSDLKYCEAHVAAFPDTLAGAKGLFASTAPPTYSFITPSNDYNQPISASDSFAKAVIGAWSGTSWWSSTVVFFMYDESSDSDTSCPNIDGLSGTCGGHIFLAAVSPYTSGVGSFTAKADTFSLYATTAWLLGLPAAGTGSPMKGLFAFQSVSPLSASLSVSPSSVNVGSSATFTASASGGEPPYTYAYSSLPTGCAAGNVSTFSCTPSAAGTYTVTLALTDSGGGEKTASATLTVTNSKPPPNPLEAGLTVSPTTVEQGTGVTFTAAASGGSPPYSYAYASLPAGCSNANVASLACTPANAGTYTVLLTVTDAASNTAGASATLTVTAAPPPPNPLVASFTVSPSTIASGASATYSIAISGGTPPYSYTVSGLPAGCSSNGLLSFSCTPDASGTFTATVDASDSGSPAQQTSASVTLTVKAPASSLVLSAISANPSLTPAPNSTYTLSAVAHGGTTPYSYQWAALPPGCVAGVGSSANSASCIADVNGTFLATLEATDASGTSTESTATIIVQFPPPPPASPPGTGSTPTAPFSTQSLVDVGMAGVAGVGAALVALKRWEIGLPVLAVGLGGFFLL
jgi:hypothetical protein